MNNDHEKRTAPVNETEKREISRRLREMPGADLTNDEAEQLLDAELRKPADQIDVEAVEELLAMLEPQTPSEEALQADWTRIEKKLPRARKRWLRDTCRWGRIAACILGAGVLAYASFQTARAFDWRLLGRWLHPSAQTFSLGSDEQPETTDACIYTDAEAAVVSGQFTDLADFPETCAGYRTRPAWVPERFTFLNGTLYQDCNMTRTSATYLSGDTVCFVSMTLVNQQQTVVDFL